ncbi:DUF4259 domain-containing protein [Streptomyces sp. DT24]|uniref:DUF4259 domain-containing protein n=1 Tax=unclassified Streptomyces TaxID=2593676 RepID=UPI0023B9816B|nr:DUF4259 domain-containing protein [Streptomyces sp. AM 4-1-1]WEH33969.1 DUF4259 domain-containing protein [Streptomyces sp. AM 4-1-1]
MGTWGSGNFDNDTAADHLSGVIARLVGEVTEAMADDPVTLEADEYWGNAVPCHLELLYVLYRAGHTSPHLPRPDVIEGWKKDFMAVWEKTIDGLEPSPAFKRERRSVLNRTFDQLIEAATTEAAALTGI